MRTYKTILLASATLVVLAMLPATAQAQRRGFRMGVMVGGGYFYDPWYQYPYPPYGLYPGYYDNSAALRIEVTPKQADVYVDGYHAGIVDDFDGIFQRLHVRPGGHELVLFLEGYRTVQETIYLNPSQTQTIRLAMQRLGPGEVSGPRPVPPPPAAPAQQQLQFSAPVPLQPLQPGQAIQIPAVQPGAPGAIQAGPPQPMPGSAVPAQPPSGVAPPPPQQAPPPPQSMPVRSGTLAIRVQPGDAEVWVDGQRWQSPRAQDRQLILLGEGIHKLELKKAGFDTFAADVMVRSGQTTTVNVTLTKGH